MNEIRLIDANAASEKIIHDITIHADEVGIGIAAIVKAVAISLRDEKDFPTIEAEHVRFGRWKTKVIHDTYCYQCSYCNSVYIGDTHYCPNCGARMDGGADNA